MSASSFLAEEFVRAAVPGCRIVYEKVQTNDIAETIRLRKADGLNHKARAVEKYKQITNKSR